MRMLKELNHKKGFVVLFLIICLGLSACTTQGPSRSGFLSDYTKLEKNPSFKGSWIYFNPNRQLSSYSRFIVNPVQIRLSTRGKVWDVEKKRLHAISKYIHDEFVSELTKSNYDVVNAPGPETMVLRIALTEVAPTTLTTNRSLLVAGIYLGGASAEAELIDSLSGEVVAAAQESQKGDEEFDNVTKYGNAKNVIDRWVKRLIIRMDKEHGNKFRKNTTPQK